MNVYTYPRGGEESPWTAEAAVTFYMPVGPVWITFENNVDIRAYVGAYYAELGVQGGRDIAENINLEASLVQGYASADFNEAYLGLARGGFTHLTARLGLSFRAGGVLSFSPHVEAILTTNGALRAEGSPAFRFNIGLTVALGQD